MLYSMLNFHLSATDCIVLYFECSQVQVPLLDHAVLKGYGYLKFSSIIYLLDMVNIQHFVLHL